MGKEGHVGNGPPHDSQKLQEEPEAQHDDRWKTDEFNDDKDEEEGKNPGSREKEEVGAQDSGHRPAGSDHRHG